MQERKEALENKNKKIRKKSEEIENEKQLKQSETEITRKMTNSKMNKCS